jgi:hypothetical protein
MWYEGRVYRLRNVDCGLRPIGVIGAYAPEGFWIEQKEWVQSGLRVTGWGLRDACCVLRVARLRDTGCGIRVAGCGIRVAGCGLRVARLRDTGCGLRDTAAGYGVRV